jgi:hypothetical protein
MEHMIPRIRLPQNSMMQNLGDFALDSDERSSTDDDCEDGNDLSDSDAQDDTCGQDPDRQQREDYKDLGNLLRRCSIRHYDRKTKYFWTNELLDRILTLERVMEELQAYQEKDPAFFGGKPITACAKNILKEHHKVFAILTLIDKGPCIKNVIADRLKDTDLPLSTNNESPSYPLYRRSRKKSEPQKVKCLSGPDWRAPHRELFFKYQYALDPEFLDLEQDRRTPKHKEFGCETVLPFLSQEERQQGGYGVVTKVDIHPNCHGFNDVLESVRLPFLSF